MSYNEKWYLIKYKTVTEKNGLNSLTVVDPDVTLDNGNKEVVKILIGSYADEVMKELLE